MNIGLIEVEIAVDSGAISRGAVRGDAVGVELVVGGGIGVGAEVGVGVGADGVTLGSTGGPAVSGIV